MVPDDDYVDSDEEDDLDAYWEDDARYYQYLYYPINIHDVLDERYCIEHKLGHGGFSTVWMAHDMQTGKDVALKIMISGAAGQHAAQREQNMHDEIERSVKDTSRLVTYTRTFTLTGYEDREHLVLVLPLRGPSLRSYHLLDMPVTRRMSVPKQLLEILANLHASGIVHRDLNSGAVMWGMTTLDHLDLWQKYEHFGKPRKARLRPPYWKFAELVKPIEVPDALLKPEIYLCDFGLAMKSGTPAGIKFQLPLTYCAPERLHQANPTFASDMWSYMCLFAQCYLGVSPYSLSGVHRHLDNMVRSLGPLPQEWKGRSDESFVADASLYDPHRKVKSFGSLGALIDRARPDVSSAEKDLVLEVMMKVFRYKPEDRLTAAQLLEDPSFIALMEMYQV